MSPSRVSRNATCSTISISGNSQVEEVRDHVLQGDEQSAFADRDEPLEALGNLDPREPLLARLRVAHEQAEAQRKPRDVRERLARADRERSQHG